MNKFVFIVIILTVWLALHVASYSQSSYRQLVDKVMLWDGKIQIDDNKTFPFSSQIINNQCVAGGSDSLLTVIIDSLPVTTLPVFLENIIAFDSVYCIYRLHGVTNFNQQIFTKYNNQYTIVPSPQGIVVSWGRKADTIYITYNRIDANNCWNVGTMISGDSGRTFVIDSETVIPAELGYWTRFSTILNDGRADYVYTVLNQGMTDPTIIPGRGYYTRYYSYGQLSWQLDKHSIIELAINYYQEEKIKVLMIDTLFYWGSNIGGQHEGYINPAGYTIGNLKMGTYYGMSQNEGDQDVYAVKYFNSQFSIVRLLEDGGEVTIFIYDIPLDGIDSFQKLGHKFIVQTFGSKLLVSDDKMWSYRTYQLDPGTYPILSGLAKILVIKNGIIYELREGVTDIFDTPQRAKKFELNQNYPNPFNPETVLEYSLSQSGEVVLKVFDILGKEIVTLVNDYQGAGGHQINFNASQFPSGVYIYRLQIGNFISSKKMILIK